MSKPGVLSTCAVPLIAAEAQPPEDPVAGGEDHGVDPRQGTSAKFHTHPREFQGATLPVNM